MWLDALTLTEHKENNCKLYTFGFGKNKWSDPKSIFLMHTLLFSQLKSREINLFIKLNSCLFSAYKRANHYVILLLLGHNSGWILMITKELNDNARIEIACGSSEIKSLLSPHLPIVGNKGYTRTRNFMNKTKEHDSGEQLHSARTIQVNQRVLICFNRCLQHKST